MNFFLSAKGYEYLDPSSNHRPRFNDMAFLSGMEAARHRLNDPLKGTRDEGYQKELHAMVLLADDDELFLLRKTRELLNQVQAHAEICAVEHGRTMRDTQTYHSVEHFGYVDSGSQPLFFQSPNERERQKEAEAGPALVLVPDPYGRNNRDSGSNLVSANSSNMYVTSRITSKSWQKP
jgi:deferrochelatase/peroxidase EfeB